MTYFYIKLKLFRPMTLEKKMAASNEAETFVKKDEKSACKL